MRGKELRSRIVLANPGRDRTGRRDGGDGSPPHYERAVVVSGKGKWSGAGGDGVPAKPVRGWGIARHLRNGGRQVEPRDSHAKVRHRGCRYHGLLGPRREGN